MATLRVWIVRCAVALGSALAGLAGPPETRAAEPAGVVGVQGVEAVAIAKLCGPAFKSIKDASDGLMRRNVWVREGIGGSGALADRVRAALGSADFLLLGEIHDNAEHHLIQACLLSAIADRKPGLVFEQITTEEADALKSFLARSDRTAAGFGPAVGWTSRGWPEWRIYQPIAEIALEAGLDIRAGNVGRAELMAAARGGLDSVGAGERRRLGLDTTLDTVLQTALLDELAASHCGLMPAKAFDGMALAQRYRDAHMAAALVAARAEAGAAVLIAGSGHARRDRGVPWHLRAMAPDVTQLAVILVEGPDTFARVPLAPDGTPAADVVILTGEATRPDPCVEMRERFGKHRKAN